MNKGRKILDGFILASAELLLVLALAGISLETKAGEALPLSQVVSNVLRLTEPPQGYSVSVSQTVLPSPSVTSLKTAAAIPQTMTTQTFNLMYDGKQGFVHQSSPPTLHASQASNTGGSNQPTNQASVQVTINMGPFLRSLQSWPKVSVNQDILNGKPVYKIDADSGQNQACTLWVDAEHWYVSNGKIFINGKQFLEAAFEYRNVNGLWFPSKTVIDHASDGTRVMQDFGQYSPVPK